MIELIVALASLLLALSVICFHLKSTIEVSFKCKICEKVNFNFKFKELKVGNYCNKCNSYYIVDQIIITIDEDLIIISNKINSFLIVKDYKKISHSSLSDKEQSLTCMASYYMLYNVKSFNFKTNKKILLLKDIQETYNKNIKRINLL